MSYATDIFYMLFCSEITAQDKSFLKQLTKATDSMSKNSVEQTAYFRALGEKNQLNMEKYRKQVETELGKKPTGE